MRKQMLIRNTAMAPPNFPAGLQGDTAWQGKGGKRRKKGMNDSGKRGRDDTTPSNNFTNPGSSPAVDRIADC